MSNRIDPNDLLPGYETIECTSLTTKMEELVTKREVVECKQTELNMRMEVGWQENK